MERPVSHLSDDDLVLHYYGEDAARRRGAERHLRVVCAVRACVRRRSRERLSAITPPELVERADDLRRTPERCCAARHALAGAR